MVKDGKGWQRMGKDGKGWERMGKDGALALKGNARMAKVARDTHTKRMAKGAHENAGTMPAMYFNILSSVNQTGLYFNIMARSSCNSKISGSFTTSPPMALTSALAILISA